MDDQTIALYMRAVPPVAPEDSIGRAAEWMRHGASGTVPVVAFGGCVGVVDESDLRNALGSPDLPVRDFMNTDFIYLSAAASPERAVEALRMTSRQSIVVTDADGRYLGLVNAADLLSRERLPNRPPMVGGMATPFGVYLTTGIVTAGKGGWALAATGAMLFSLYLLSNFLTAGAAWLVQHGTSYRVLDWALAAPTRGLPHAVALAAQVAVLLLFLILLRTSRLAGIHGAEHMVVHAIERGERLAPDVVERMPRVHPRCGSNLAAGAILFLSLAGIKLAPDWADLGMLASLVLTLALWRPVGQFVQQLATTRAPSPQHVKQAIEAAEELLARSRRAGHPRAGISARLARSGLPQIMVGVLAIGVVLWFVSEVLHVYVPIIG
jgi:hypothetical protein